MTEFIAQPDYGSRLGDILISNFRNPRWNSFQGAVAFVKRSGTKHLKGCLREFVQRGRMRLSVGIAFRGSSKEGLADLLDATEEGGEIWVSHNENPSTFHPKVYLFRGESSGDLLVGSGNLTEGGLFTNYEATLRVPLDLGRKEDCQIVQQVEGILDRWADESGGFSKRLTLDLLHRLEERGYVLSEAAAFRGRRGHEEGIEEASGSPSVPPSPLFPRIGVRRAPPAPAPEHTPEEVHEEYLEFREPERAPAQEGIYRGFVMTLQRTDVGSGQVTEGTARRSPELFIPLAARDEDPQFWGWPGQFVPDPERPGKMDRIGVSVRLGGDLLSVNMMTWPVKHDFRLRCEALRRAGRIGDVLRLERADGSAGFTYYAEIVPQGTDQFSHFLQLCSHAVRNSQKRWGYY